MMKISKKNKRLNKELLNNKGFIKNDFEKKFSKSLKHCCLATATFLIGAVTISFSPKDHYFNPGVNYNSNFVVAHAGGALPGNDGKLSKYLNSIDGFYYYYKNGTRMFEYDLCFTSDNKLVGTHYFEYHGDFDFDNRISYEKYNNTKIEGKYTGINEDLLLELIQLYPDCKFIVDTKEKDETKVYLRLIDLANSRNVDISNGILPFVSSTEMLDVLNKKYNFKELMFTNYKNFYNTRRLLEIIKNCEKIKYLHIFPIDFFRIDIDELNRQGIRVFAHMDHSYKLKTPLRYGCSGIFSDDISENEFKDLYYPFLAKVLNIDKKIDFYDKYKNIKNYNPKNSVKYLPKIYCK